MENELADRQLDAILQRLDRLCNEVHTLNRRLENADGLARVTHEIRSLNESLQALAYAALGHSGPQVRRRRAGYGPSTKPPGRESSRTDP